jgi:hypothetical protein
MLSLVITRTTETTVLTIAASSSSITSCFVPLKGNGYGKRKIIGYWAGGGDLGGRIFAQHTESPGSILSTAAL